MITNLVILIISILSIISFRNRKFYSALFFHPNKKLQLYRYISYSFIHTNYIHLIVNVFIFFIFGSLVEKNLGEKLYFIFIFLSIVFSILPYITKDFIIVGFSGCTSALIYFCILQHPAFFWISVPYILYCWYGDYNNIGNIAHASHLYGSMFAFIFIFILFPNIIFNIFAL